MRRRSRWAVAATSAVVLALGMPARVGRAQQPADSAPAPGTRRVTVIPGAKYRAGWLHEAVLGADYRALWTTPIEVDVLDLQREAGGLTATQKGGSMQTNSLRFKAGNGREYVFRPLEKDFTKGLPPELLHTLVKNVAQDQVAGYHPAAPIVVSRLLDATGIHHPRPRLVVMPDDPALGEFRREFAGVLGTFEERPDDDFGETANTPGARDVISSERLFERMRKDPANVVDARAFLAARLFDILVGDRDRHRDQWRWANFDRGRRTTWEPIPRDRDMPFAKFEGLGPWAVRGFNPQMVTFGKRYPNMVWLNWNAREIDRMLLSGLERSVWDSVTAALQAAISDAEIDSAIAQMPAPFVAKNGPDLRATLIARRTQLPRVSREYYEILATEVDFHGSDRADVAEITREPDGHTRVSLFAADSARSGSDNSPYLTRRFDPADTREVRLFLYGGSDQIVVRGAGRAKILVRAIADSGDDALVDSIAGGDRALRIYDATGRVSGARGLDRSVYTPPPIERPEDPARDWGTWSYRLQTLSFAPGLGLMAGASWTHFQYGFRADPFVARHVIRGDFSFGEMRPRVIYDGEFRGTNPARFRRLELTASGIELIRFHGLGNDSPSDADEDFYKVFQNLLRVEPSMTFRLAPRTHLALGARAQYTATRENDETLVGVAHPYGSGRFGEVGATAELSIDRRDVMNAPGMGFTIDAGASAFPAVWSLDRAYGEVHGTAAAYARAKVPMEPTLAVRLGGQHVWGRFPFHDAAFLGGISTLRGWDQQRFAGRSSVFGSAELRVFALKSFVLVPADVGLLGFVDAGRVYADGDVGDDGPWHTGIGGGVWFAPLTRANTVSLSIGWGKERSGIYVRSGFAF